MAAGSTYTPIATTTFASSASSYTFSSIPTTYTDLVLVVVPAQGAPTGSSPLLQVGNGSVDTGTNYSYTSLRGNGTSATSIRDTNLSNIPEPLTGMSGNLGEYQIIYQLMNYSNTSTYKTILFRLGSLNATYPGTVATVGLWRSTSAINTIKFYVSGTGMSIGTTLTLYGILAA